MFFFCGRCCFCRLSAGNTKRFSGLCCAPQCFVLHCIHHVCQKCQNNERTHTYTDHMCDSTNDRNAVPKYNINKCQRFFGHIHWAFIRPFIHSLHLYVRCTFYFDELILVVVSNPNCSKLSCTEYIFRPRGKSVEQLIWCKKLFFLFFSMKKLNFEAMFF